MNPSPLQTDSSVPRAIQQVGSQEAANIIEDRSFASWMEAVTPEIHAHSPDFEATCVAAYGRATLEDMHCAIAARRQLPGGTQTRGSCSDYGDVHPGSLIFIVLDPSVIEFQVSFRCPVSQKGLVAFFTELVPAAGRTAQLLDRGQQFFAGVVRQAPRTLLNNFRQPSEIMHDHRGLTRERFNGYDTKRFVCNRRHQARHRVIVKSPQLLLRLRSQEMDARIGGRLAPQLHGVSSAACDQQIVAWNLAPQGDEILHSFDVLQATHKQKIRPWVGAIHGLLPVAVRAREEIRQTLQRPLKPTLRMHAHAKFAGREELVDCRAFSLQ